MLIHWKFDLSSDIQLKIWRIAVAEGVTNWRSVPYWRFFIWYALIWNLLTEIFSYTGLESTNSFQTSYLFSSIFNVNIRVDLQALFKICISCLSLLYRLMHPTNCTNNFYNLYQTIYANTNIALLENSFHYKQLDSLLYFP